MDQAIADAALFAKTLKQELGLNGKWVLIGASYPANLAAYARALHPDIFDMALASSAPVLSKLDFFGFLEMVDKAMRLVDPECPGVIQASTDELEALIAAGNSARISEVFK
jgi:pimeloyl-ACP methyl ester carboxylesterase